tara:strand:- start:43 stop:144 length:102 start_codon:yes stop_codon:yes gene_type:complete
MTVEQLEKSMTVQEFVYWMVYLEEVNKRMQKDG